MFGGSALPVALAGHVTVNSEDLTISNIDATIAGAVVRGHIGATVLPPHRLQGEIDAERLDGTRLLAAAIGMPAGRDGRWSDQPFGAGVFGDYTGKIALKVRSFDVAPVAAHEFATTVNFDKSRFSFDDVTGGVAGGRLTGALSFQSSGGGLRASAKVALADADARMLLGQDGASINGRLSVSGEVEGAGLSPVALIGALHGRGQVTLGDGLFARLDPHVFQAVTHAVDQGLVIDERRISDLVSKTLDGGSFTCARAQGEVIIGNGQMRLDNFEAASGGTELSAAGRTDLMNGSLNGRVLLSQAGRQGDTRPQITIVLKGSPAVVERSIEVAALTAWLTARAIENQTRQLRAIEAPKPGPAPPRPRSELAPKPPSAAPKRAPPLPPPLQVAPLRTPQSSAVGAQR